MAMTPPSQSGYPKKLKEEDFMTSSTNRNVDPECDPVSGKTTDRVHGMGATDSGESSVREVFSGL
jgi:hypothetical protein